MEPFNTLPDQVLPCRTLRNSLSSSRSWSAGFHGGRFGGFHGDSFASGGLRFVLVQQTVGELAMTAIEFPPMQAPA